MDLPEAEGQVLADEVSEVQQVAALMQARITQNWRRPPSARNGMEVLLEISLVPTGDVVGISVLSSSGSIAFDRSAIAAVERVAQFSEVAVLPISDFERYFRRFPLRFKPEDLRY
jgi:colicin import membrane protein